MDLDIREAQLRKRIDEQDYVLCKNTLQELIDNKFKRARNQFIAFNKLNDLICDYEQRELKVHVKRS